MQTRTSKKTIGEWHRAFDSGFRRELHFISVRHVITQNLPRGSEVFPADAAKRAKTRAATGGSATCRAPTLQDRQAGHEISAVIRRSGSVSKIGARAGGAARRRKCRDGRYFLRS